MKRMTDPMDALRSMQDCLVKRVPLGFRACVYHRDMKLLLDSPTGEPRLSYALIDGVTVKALCIFAHGDPIDGVPCFDIGFAVAEKFRRKGLGKSMVENCIDELSKGMRGKFGPKLYIEAIVGADNVGSRKIAELVISSSPESCTDEHSGQAAFSYQRLVVL